MIKTFKDQETEKVFHRHFSRKLPPLIQLVALHKLRMFNNAYSAADLRVPPANHIEKLTGNEPGNTVSESTIIGEYVLSGVVILPITLKSQIIIRGMKL